MWPWLRGVDDAVRRYAKRWRVARGVAMAEAFVPLRFAPGEAYQFDWSHEVVLINGVTVTVKEWDVRLCHSRMIFVRAYPRETRKMVFDAHNRAFAFFRGTCTRGIYDTMKTAVETVFIGKVWPVQSPFSADVRALPGRADCLHAGFGLGEGPEPAPAQAGVENQVGLVREVSVRGRGGISAVSARRAQCPITWSSARVSDGWSPGRAAKVEEVQTLHPKPPEDPITDERMALIELLQKSG